jgi:putative heme-binding domain-containing protein
MSAGWTFIVLVLAAGPHAEDRAQGQRLFERQCARCHGLKGGGGGGPSLTRARLRHAPDEKALRDVIREGIPGTEMEGAWQMAEAEIERVATYVRSLGQIETAELPGDPEKGKAAFEKGDCAQCHAVRGHGGSLGPDLTEVGGRRGATYLRQALHEPGTNETLDAAGFRAYLVVLVATQDGRIVRGLRVNEDTFTLQIRDADNRIHSFAKRELAEMKRELGGSLMPSYQAAVSAAELDDLVAYLRSLRGEP